MAQWLAQNVRHWFPHVSRRLLQWLCFQSPGQKCRNISVFGFEDSCGLPRVMTSPKKCCLKHQLSPEKWNMSCLLIYIMDYNGVCDYLLVCFSLFHPLACEIWWTATVQVQLYYVCVAIIYALASFGVGIVLIAEEGCLVNSEAPWCFQRCLFPQHVNHEVVWSCFMPKFHPWSFMLWKSLEIEQFQETFWWWSGSSASLAWWSWPPGSWCSPRDVVPHVAARNKCQTCHNRVRPDLVAGEIKLQFFSLKGGIRTTRSSLAVHNWTKLDSCEVF